MSENEKDQEHDKRLLGLKIHFIVYISVNILLFIINFLTGYSVRWHMWPLMSWGIAIVLHAAIIILINIFDNTYDRSLAIHASITIITSAYLIWNDWFEDRKIQWFIFAVIPLALIWLNHYGINKIVKPQFGNSDSRFNHMVLREMENIDPEVKEPNRIARKIVLNRLVFVNHVIIYIAVNSFLFILNILNGLDYAWFLWPAMSWGVNIFFHAIFYFASKKKAFGQKMSIKIFLAYPASISLYLVFVDGFSDGRFNWFWWAVIPIALISLLIVRGRSEKKMKDNNQKVITPTQKSQPGYQYQQPIRVQVQNVVIRKFCAKCGKPTKRGHKFCEFCGFQIN
ncbi:hypothetical protein NEF87_002121 [Candidatus Lokiarchaeum ossiferum]|uniref:2TM domain-containing protein n=1 Tax=Candidatus Lokiarchaeum ossiferum TaxID=2951803 RepID=A0ABY6HQP9_9ARCH|nr:hypothetical protein NEF87_002121 [Candidatus Lokiarchaeum sp. B-35]